MKDTSHLATLLAAKKLIQAPGVFDPITAKIAQSVGFQAVYMTGFGTSVSSYGLPDIGLLTLTEMVENASRIAEAIRIPLISDADTGYGNPINVYRTVREFEKAGVAAIHLEDQSWPKRCGHMAGKTTISASDMVEKIKAAVDARRSPDFLIIARTDAIATHGFASAIERGHRYAEAGADILFIEAPRDAEQVKSIPRQIRDKPHIINLAPLTPNFAATELNEMGYSIALYPGICLAAKIAACTSELENLKRTGRQKEFSEWRHSFEDLNRFMDVPFFTHLEQKYKTD